MEQEHHVASFVKYHRSRLKLTQEQLAERAGVGLRFVRDLEQGKETLRMDKVNQVLQLFGCVLSAKPLRLLDPYEILLYHLNKNVHVYLKNKNALAGFLIEPVSYGTEIKAWKFVSNDHAIEYRKTKNAALEQTIHHADIERIENK